MDGQCGRLGTGLDPVRLEGYGHDGAFTGQYGYPRVVPPAGVAVVLLTNGGGARELHAALFRGLLAELAGVAMPASFAPPAEPPAVDFAPFVGTYRREGVVITVTEQEGAGHAVYEVVDGMRDYSELLGADPVPVTDTVFADTGVGATFSEDYTPVVSSTLRGTARAASTSACAAPPKASDTATPRRVPVGARRRSLRDEACRSAGEAA